MHIETLKKFNDEKLQGYIFVCNPLATDLSPHPPFPSGTYGRGKKRRQTWARTSKGSLGEREKT
jgi:hypothetical protein